MKRFAVVLLGCILVWGGCVVTENAEHKDISAGSDVTVKELRCEYHVDPLGIDVVKPRLDWIIESGQRGQKQTAYQILVAGSEENIRQDKGDLWDTGTVKSDQSIQITYNGRPLESQMRCWWKVRIWDKDGRVSGWSAPATWSIGLLNPSDWKTKWITDDVLRKEKTSKIGKSGKTVYDFKRNYLPAAYMRKAFSIDKPVRRATVYATALGLYELYINGQRVGEDYFTPGWTVYQKRVNYRTYDVTGLIHQNGANAIGAIVGDGWYIMLHNEVSVGQKIKLLAQLNIEYADGTSQTVATDESWKMSDDGPILTSDIYNGEDYDARKEIAGWNEPGFDDGSWKPVVLAEDIKTEVSAFPGVPVRRTMEIKPVGITEPKPGVYVFNMGQNFAGWVRLKVKGPVGTKVTMRFAEMLNTDGTIYTKNLRKAKCTDTYILKGGADEIWEPRFTYHGFQYVELTGYPDKPALDAITGVVLRSNAPIVGSFECSNQMLNKLYSNILWGQRSNYFETPTDCPQRDERMGWTGDAQVFIRTGVYSMDLAAFFTSWIITLNDNQYQDGTYPVVAPNGDKSSSAGWSDAAIICPWVIYRVYGDKRILEKHYGGMAKWMERRLKDSNDFLLPKAFTFGDWLNIKADLPRGVINAAYFAYSAELMSKIAKVLGKNDDVRKYEKLFDNIKKAFNKAYISGNGVIQGNTQTAYLMALHFDLLPKDKRKLAEEHLIERIENRDWRLSTGFLGVNLLLPTLTEIGRLDVAYRLLTNETYPSWGYSVKHGATTVWERWDGWTEDRGFQNPGMNSFNHYAYGSAGEWMFSTVAGIDTDGPAYKKIIIRPELGGGLTYVKANYKSIYGEIATHWKIDGDTLKLDVTIPANTTATIYVPAKSASSVTEGGKEAGKSTGLKFLRMEKGKAVFAAGSGQYKFDSEL